MINQHEASLVSKWTPVLDHPELSPIKDPYRRAVTALCLENQQKEMAIENSVLTESGLPVNNVGDMTGGIQKYDPIMISLVRRALPNLMAYDICGVQPMTGPTGLIFAMRSKYGDQSGPEAFFNEANTIFSGIVSAGGIAGDTANNPVANLASSSVFTTGKAMSTAAAEALGVTGGTDFGQMSFTIEKVSVTAETRALKSEYTMELAQDLKAIHGLDAETEIANILSTEILSEINRQVIRTIYQVAVPGAQWGTVTPGVFDLDTDSNGRWSVERFKGLIFQIEKECNAIAKGTRRGKGNILIVSSDVASALHMAGVLQHTPDLSANLQVDDTGNTYCGMLHGKIKVYIDPYFGGMSSGFELACVGYKGQSAYDAGIFYCPYVPLQMVRAVDPNTFQPKVGFKCRQGIVANPYAEGLDRGLGALNARKNQYYRLFAVKNLL